MKQIVVLGAGQSTPYLIAALLEQAEIHDWFVTVCDHNYHLAEQRLAGHPRGQAIVLDINDAEARAAQL